MTEQNLTPADNTRPARAAVMTLSLKPWLKSYTSANEIDWLCRHPLTATGAIDHRRAEGFQSRQTRPVPVIARNSEQYIELIDAVEHVRALAIPATPAEAGFELKRLSVWCPMGNRDSRDFKIMIHDALTDLAEFPPDLLQKACAIYRNDPDPRCDFFPRPGRLKALVADDLRLRKQLLFRLERLLVVANEPPKLPPPITLRELEHQAETSLEVEALMAQISGRTHTPLPPAEYKAELARRTEKKIREAVSEQQLSPEMAERMLHDLRDFTNPQPDAPHEKTA